MNKEDVIKLSKILFDKITKKYGLSKHHPSYPYLEIDDSPYSDAEDPNLIAEYRHWDNEMIIYWKNIESEEVLIRTLLHEYKHYLQSPTWYTRYWKTHDYRTHPYEIEAYAEEEKWKNFC